MTRVSDVRWSEVIAGDGGVYCLQWVLPNIGVNCGSDGSFLLCTVGFVYHGADMSVAASRLC